MWSFLKGLAAFVLATIATVAGYYIGIILALVGGILLGAMTLLSIIGLVAAAIYGYWTSDPPDTPQPPTKR